MNVLPGVEATHYRSDGSFQPVEPEVTELEARAMGMAMAWADESLKNGDPPVGAVLLDRRSGQEWGANTSDKSAKHILAHAEIRAYEAAQPIIGDDLEDCVLVTTSQPCTTCTPPYVEGKIGKIIYAASREQVYPITGIMRPREINMHELLVDGDTDTLVIGGYRVDEALGKFTMWADMQDFAGVPEAPDTIR